MMDLMCASLSPWVVRCGHSLRLRRQSIDPLDSTPPLDALTNDEDLASSLWLTWQHLKRFDQHDWIWILETMELLDLLARVDHETAWTLILNTMQQAEFLPLLVETVKCPLRFSMVLTDRFFREDSWIQRLYTSGELLSHLETHTPHFAQAKNALLEFLPLDFKRDASTKIPLWIIQDPEDMHRWDERTEQFMHGIAALAEWWHEYQHDDEERPLSCFAWTRLTLDIHHTVMLDRLGPSIIPRLMDLGIEIYLLTPTSALPQLLDKTHSLRSTRTSGGVRTLLLSMDTPFDAFVRACEAIYERREATFDVLCCPRWPIELESAESETLQLQRWEWLVVALFCRREPATTLPLGRIWWVLSELTDSQALTVKRVIEDHKLVIAALKGTVPPYASLRTKIRPRVMAVNHLRISMEESIHLEAVTTFLRSVSPVCRRLEIMSRFHDVGNTEAMLRAILDSSPALERLDISLDWLSNFTWRTDLGVLQLRALSLDATHSSGTADGLLHLFEILGDNDHPLSRTLERLQLSWGFVKYHFPALLACLGQNYWLDRCVLVDTTTSFTEEYLAAFKAHEVAVVREKAPLPLRARLAFLSAGRREEGPFSRLYEAVASGVGAHIFKFAAEHKCRRCLVTTQSD